MLRNIWSSHFFFFFCRVKEMLGLMGRIGALRICAVTNAQYGYLYCSIWQRCNGNTVLGTKGELKWRLKPYVILANVITSKWFLLFFLHTKCLQHSDDMFLSVLICKYGLSTTQNRKVFVENKNRLVTAPVLSPWFQGKSDLWLCSAVGHRPQPIGNLQSCGRGERLWSTALREFQGLVCFWPNPNVNSFLGPYLLTLAGLRN